MKIKVGDTVVVITGKDSGKQGEVIKTLAKSGRVIVKDLNIATKHVKKTAERAGERVEMEVSLDVSNVMLLDSAGKATRVGYSLDKKGKKSRVEKTTGKEITENFKKS